MKSYKINAMHSIVKNVRNPGILRAAQGFSEMPQVYSGLLRSAQGCPKSAQGYSEILKDTAGTLGDF